MMYIQPQLREPRFILLLTSYKSKFHTQLPLSSFHAQALPACPLFLSCPPRHLPPTIMSL
jgi:hypothetical protein